MTSNANSIDVDTNIGAEIIHRHRGQFAEIHNQIRQTSSSAQEVAKTVSSVCAELSVSERKLDIFYQELAALPDISATIDSICLKTEELAELFTNVDNELWLLSDMCEERRHRRELLQRQTDVVVYRKQKLAELEQRKVKLATDHAARMSAKEKEMLQMQKDKQRVYEEAFRQDLQEFLATKDTVEEAARANAASQAPGRSVLGVQLEDVSIDPDDASKLSLDQFLEDDPEKRPSGEQLVPAAGVDAVAPQVVGVAAADAGAAEQT